MKQGEDFKGCRYYGYEPASAEFLHKPMERVEKDAIRAQHKADVAAIKAIGFRPSNMGYTSRKLATAAAKAIEEASGVELRIINHDYM